MRINIHSQQAGFSLIELMVVIVIIGILANVAIPVYQDFISKTQIHDAYQELSTLKVPLDIKQLNGAVVTDATELGWLTEVSGLIQSSPVVTFDSGTGKYSLEATIDGNAYPVAVGVKIKLLQSLQGGWVCILTKSSSTAWKDNLAPKQCQVVD